MAKSGQTRQNLFLFHIHVYFVFFSGVNNIPDGFSDNWKEAKFNKIDPYQSGFFFSRKQFLFIFLSHSAANIVSSIRITDRWIL